MPVQMFYEINEHQLASTGLCQVLFAGFGLPLNISCLTILLIAFDRYRMIVHPLKMQMSTRVAMCLIGCVILFGGLNSVPVALHVHSAQMTNYAYCVEKWPSAEMRLIYSVCVFLICFVLPLAASGGFYLSIYRRLAQHSTQLGLRKEAERRKRRTTSLLVWTVVCFVLCWTPWCLYSLLLEIQSLQTRLVQKQRLSNRTTYSATGSILEMCARILQKWMLEQKDSHTMARELTKITLQYQSNVVEIIPGQHIKLIDLICKMIAMGSACVNPFIYGWLNEPIQCAMRRQYGRMTECLKLRSSGHTQSAAADTNCRPSRTDVKLVIGPQTQKISPTKQPTKIPSTLSVNYSPNGDSHLEVT
ncbi:uncharacterized protein DEA37_0008454 [Paragonimus westermani]|uniref:G-protein coupled receptors family 1 profile domain-containing protein n=1 Tax=Paragonimus westermani TaxID=34504 RepID=A0A5J4P2N6_9TREM|nr:uncharacterized protein DEA37_0008454 [Paragonimus westermani]